MNGIRDAVIWEETTLIGPNLLSLFFEGLFFFRLIPPAILNQIRSNKTFCNVFLMKRDVYEDTNITNVYFSSYINTKDFLKYRCYQMQLVSATRHHQITLELE